MKLSTFILFNLPSLLLFYLSFSVSALEQQVDINIINSEPFVKVIERTGKLGFKRTLNLSFKTAGYLANIPVDEGDLFVKGQVLAELDTFELVTKKNASYAQLLQAKQDVQRIESLLAKKLSSRQALDNAKTLVETTRSNYRIAQYNVEKAQLIAPFDGVVLARQSELTELQSPNKPVLQIAATSNNLVVRVGLTADEVSLVKPNQLVEVNHSAGFSTGSISKIPLLNGAISHLYDIEVFLADLDVKDIIVGQTVKVIIKVDTQNYVYSLPIAALNSVNNQGEALITLQLRDDNSQTNYLQQTFVIEHLSNNFIYLLSEQNSPPLKVIIQGWQSIAQLNQHYPKPINQRVNKSTTKNGLSN